MKRFVYIDFESRNFELFDAVEDAVAFLKKEYLFFEEIEQQELIEYEDVVIIDIEKNRKVKPNFITEK